ncbi:hypothetical protein Ais01nite_70090 [Asanoa ishikariensis]|uniref:LPXTG-motif cell wall anchor domain-containing protein n=1 Tax=Asanoa ishikariensis TaxID=137265 RepID=A0A1H3MXU2_9ACTN|nr:hypothetical protein [Asanoa ishikariensis]GIF68974.1 hypothetical protein Ais01nite_70090 [Asanoa ishikariensis]SDY81547.1 hypothetical protein SAMN05421684_1696 [Asanoa ishikariensis]
MGKLRTRVGLGAAVVGFALALSSPAFADGARFQITSPQTGSTISNTPTVRGIGQPGARVAVEALSQRNNDNNHWNNGNGQPGNNGPGNNQPGNGPGNNGPGNNGPGNNQPGNGASNGPGNNQPGNNGNQWNNERPTESDAAAAGTCNTTVGQNGYWSCTISPRLRPGTYRVVARQSIPGGGNEVSSVDNLTVPGGALPVTPGPDPVPVVAGGLVLLAGGAIVIAATRTRRRGKHAA